MEGEAFYEVWRSKTTSEILVGFSLRGDFIPRLHFENKEELRKFAEMLLDYCKGNLPQVYYNAFKRNGE